MNEIKKIMTIIGLISALLLTINYHTVEAGLKDRAFATHNVGKVGFFTTNIGQFYPYGGQFEKTLEYPINSGHICMYRQCLMIGVPVNVVSAADGRFEEFDAVGGYNAGKAEIAMSDNPLTWPDWGWPVQDEQGNPIIISQQESFCVYSDSTNWRYYNNHEQDKLLDLRVHQTIHSWGVPGADKFIVLKFEIENKSEIPYEDLYFNFYSDLDIGGISNDANEWADDCIDFDVERRLIYFYDSDNYSNDWEEPDPFLAGISFLETPNDMGITDWHWIDVTIDEVAVNSAFWDSVSYYLMRSDTSFFHDHPDLDVDDYFHLGENPINGTHYDDPQSTRIQDDEGNLVGGAMVAYICNGPVNIQAKEKVQYVVGIIVADTKEELIELNDQLWYYYEDGFNIPTVPNPVVEAESSDRSVTLYWSNLLDATYVNPVNDINDLEGYLIYRTTDQTLKDWAVLDTIPMQFKNDTTIMARAYQFADINVFNGFNYFYNVSAYRTGLTGKLEESIRLSDINNITNQENAISITPMTQAAATAGDIEKIKVVPNPYIVSAAWDEARLGNSPFGEPIRNLAFTHLPSPCTIKIFTVDGDLINTIYHDNSTGREEWNLLTSENRPVVSGIYFYHVDSELGEKVGRFAIIR
ncbi:hypothetical protein JXB12_06910 [candidate division KSB1 bacterium]|nr:hypothetical protein [candidate division KSB1 bacterium]